MARIYTRTGDDGRTFCAALGKRVDKDHPAIEAVGTLDELNSAIGVARAEAEGKGYTSLAKTLRRIQQELFILGYALSGRGRAPDPKWLEELIDEAMKGIELRWFVLPSGGVVPAMLHYARTVCRRLERRLVSAEKGGLRLAEGTIPYVNRLSDALYAIAVKVSMDEGSLEYAPRPVEEK